MLQNRHWYCIQKLELMHATYLINRSTSILVWNENSNIIVTWIRPFIHRCKPIHACQNHEMVCLPLHKLNVSLCVLITVHSLYIMKCAYQTIVYSNIVVPFNISVKCAGTIVKYRHMYLHTSVSQWSVLAYQLNVDICVHTLQWYHGVQDHSSGYEHVTNLFTTLRCTWHPIWLY